LKGRSERVIKGDEKKRGGRRRMMEENLSRVYGEDTG
jgi:hypothetical protein